MALLRIVVGQSLASPGCLPFGWRLGGVLNSARRGLRTKEAREIWEEGLEGGGGAEEARNMEEQNFSDNLIQK